MNLFYSPQIKFRKMTIRSGYERDKKPKINKGDIALLIAIVLAFICCLVIVSNN